MRRAGVVALILSAGVVACDDDPSGPGGTQRPDVVSAVIVDSLGTIFRSLDVTLEDAGQVEVFYQPVAGGRTLRMRSSAAATRHEVLLPRLRASTNYQYAVRTFNSSGAADSIVRGTFSTGPLPGVFSQLEYTVEGESTFPILMVPIRGGTLGGWQGQVAVESDGAITWYYQSAGGTLVAHPVPGSNDMVFIEGGFPGDPGRNAVVRVSPDRKIVAMLDRSTAPVDFGQIHHDMVAADNERVFFLAFDTMTVRDTTVNGEAVWEWNMSTGEVVKRWSSWDFFDWDLDRAPGASPQGWMHANSIMVGPRGNLVISSRTLSQVFSISADFDSIEYRLGGLNRTVGVSPEDEFVGQHAAWELPGNRVLLFDNRGAGPDSAQSSRALELQLDGDTAWVVWQYDPTPPISSPLRGGVYRLPGGNTVTIFASLPFQVHETTPEGDVIWSFTANDLSFTNTFRVTPWASIAGEVEVDAMP